MYYKKQDLINVRLDDLEMSVLSCLFHKPELMKDLKLEDKHFKKTKKLWLFMKSFYNRFHNFDLNLMYSVVGDRQHMMDMATYLLDIEPVPSYFYQYQEELIRIYNQKEDEKKKINIIYGMSNDLITGLLTLDEYYEKVKRMMEGK